MVMVAFLLLTILKLKKQKLCLGRGGGVLSGFFPKRHGSNKIFGKVDCVVEMLTLHNQTLWGL